MQSRIAAVAAVLAFLLGAPGTLAQQPPRISAPASAAQKVALPLDIRFDPGSIALTAAGRAGLDALIAKIAELRQLEIIIIVGHADSSDGGGDTARLSMQRAQAVVSYFVGKGIDQRRLYAEAGPARPAGAPAGYRMVELEVIGTR
jgi:outer membrane protein OmpA-like peptidoglycan-associated protein